MVTERMLKIGHGNGHNHITLVEFIRRQRCDSFGADETQKLQPVLENMDWARVVAAEKGWTEERNRARSTCVVTDNDNPNIGEITRKASERVKDHLYVAPDRVLVGSFYQHPVARAAGAEGIAHFEFHPNAGPWVKNDESKHAVTKEYVDSVFTTRIWIKAAKADGLIPIITGDFQMQPELDVPWNPYTVLAGSNLDMAYKNVGIDGIMWDKRIAMTSPFQLVKLVDHTGFTVHFGAA